MKVQEDAIIVRTAERCRPVQITLAIEHWNAPRLHPVAATGNAETVYRFLGRGVS